MFDISRGDTASWSQKNGTFAARIRIENPSRGLWPAFWMEGANKSTVSWPEDGEIDVFEAVGQRPAVVQQHIEGGRTLRTAGSGWSFPTRESITGWHVYAVDWTPYKIEWEVDGRTTLTIASSEGDAVWISSFEHPFAIRLDLTVGGNLPGAADSSSEFPAKMLVDWVRVSAGY